MYKNLTFDFSATAEPWISLSFWNCIEENRVGVTLTVIGIFSFFCFAIRYSAAMAPSLNYIRIHGCLVFHVVSELPIRSALFDIKAD